MSDIFDNDESSPRKYTNKNKWITSVIASIVIALIYTFPLEEVLYDSLIFIYYFTTWTLTLYTMMHIMENKRKDKYIKGAWYVGVLFIPIVFVPLYYYLRNSYSPKSLNPEFEKVS